MRLQVIVFFLFLFSCNQSLPEKHFKSIDEATGGFYDFTLVLHKDGKLDLTIISSNAVEEKETGTNWTEKTKVISGVWEMTNDKILYSINEPQSSIDSIWVNTGFSFSNKPVISFSKKNDTAFVYGIPCIISEK